VPLTCDVIGKDDEQYGSGEQTFKSDVVGVEVPGEYKYMPNGKNPNESLPLACLNITNAVWPFEIMMCAVNS
jgi:hypothetical protein